MGKFSFYRFRSAEGGILPLELRCIRVLFTTDSQPFIRRPIRFQLTLIADVPSLLEGFQYTDVFTGLFSSTSTSPATISPASKIVADLPGMAMSCRRRRALKKEPNWESSMDRPAVAASFFLVHASLIHLHQQRRRGGCYGAL